MNILFTTLSVKYRQEDENFYYCKKNSEKEYCKGTQQQEPGAKFILSCSEIDKIVVLGSNEVLENNDKPSKYIHGLPEHLSDLKDVYSQIIADYYETTTFEYFMAKLYEFQFVGESFTCTGNNPLQSKNFRNDIDVIFVPEKDEDGNDNIIGIINALRGTENNTSNLFIDVQGGKRTSIFIINALLQLLGKQSAVYHTNLEKTISVNFTRGQSENEIIDETERYQIVDLISGMNAFLDYGKAGILTNYLKRIKNPDKSSEKLIKAMQCIDNAIAFSKVSDNEESEDTGESGVGIRKAIQLLRDAINSFEENDKAEDTTFLSNILRTLIDGIRNDYGVLLESDEINVVDLTKWCLNKQNYITASVVIESLFPSYFVKHGILYYAKSEDELERAKERFKFYKCASGKNEYFFNNINHYYIKKYIKSVGVFLTSKTDIKPSSKNREHFEKLLKYPANYPIKFYTDYDYDITYEILNLYEFISKNRNALVHPSDTNVSADILKKCIEDIVKEIQALPVCNAVYHLNDEELKGVSFSPEEKSEIWKNALKGDTCGKNEWGLMWFCISNAKVKQSRFSSLYAHGGILTDLKNYYHFNKNSSDQEVIDFYKNNKIISKMLTVYYNIKNNTEYDYELLSKINLKAKTAINKEKTIELIKKDLKSYPDFYSLIEFLETEEKWNNYVEKKQKEYQDKQDKNGYDDEMKESLNKIKKILSYSKNQSNIWKPILNDLIINCDDEIWLNELKNSYQTNQNKSNQEKENEH